MRRFAPPGHRSARYTSPHLVDLSERFVIDGRPVTDDALAAAVDDVRDGDRRLRADGRLDVQPTFFEVTTAVAFELFRRADVDVAVLEVGLGGRLDATNVVTPPALVATAITSIAFDHQLYLGTTLREIALEKAGIIKPGVPVVVGPLDPEAEAAIDEVAASLGAPVVRPSARDCDGLTVGLAGVHQRSNAAVALRLLQLARRERRRRARRRDRGRPGAPRMAGPPRGASPRGRTRAAARRRAQPGRRRVARVLPESGGRRATAARLRRHARQGCHGHVRGSAAGRRPPDRHARVERAVGGACIAG